MVWGLWHGLFSALESLKIIDIKRISGKIWGRVCGHVYTLLAVCLGFVMFRASGFDEGWRIISAMFGAYGATNASVVALHSIMSAENTVYMLLAAVLSMPVAKKVEVFFASRGKADMCEAVSYVLCAAMLALCFTELASGGFTPFIYFQF